MINLLPPIVKQNRIYGRRNAMLFGYSLALTATALITAGIMIVSIKFVSSEEPNLKTSLSEDQVTIQSLEKKVKEIESISNQLDVAKKINDESVSFSELIPKIGALLPDGVVLNALTLEGGSKDPLQLDADMIDAGLGPVLIRNLVESDLFEAADISSLSPLGTSDANSGGYQFTASITASFTGTAEAAKKAAAAAAAKKAAAQAQTNNTQGSNQ